MIDSRLNSFAQHIVVVFVHIVLGKKWVSIVRIVSLQGHSCLIVCTDLLKDLFPSSGSEGVAVASFRDTLQEFDDTLEVFWMPPSSLRSQLVTNKQEVIVISKVLDVVNGLLHNWNTCL